MSHLHVIVFLKEISWFWLLYGWMLMLLLLMLLLLLLMMMFRMNSVFLLQCAQRAVCDWACACVHIWNGVRDRHAYGLCQCVAAAAAAASGKRHKENRASSREPNYSLESTTWIKKNRTRSVFFLSIVFLSVRSKRIETQTNRARTHNAMAHP